MTTEPSTKGTTRRTLRIEWREKSRPLTVAFFREKASSVCICGAARRYARRMVDGMRPGPKMFAGRKSSLWGASGGFTLLELMVVLAIIGLIAGMTLPHLRGFSKSNSMNAATHQIMDDVAYARQRAVANRSTVFMVFTPPNPWNNLPAADFDGIAGPTFTNLIQSQYRGYALISLRSVGDQPGQGHPSYISDWKTLPDGVFFPTTQFVPQNQNSKSSTIYTTNTLANVTHTFVIYPFTNNITRSLPFPTLQYFTTNLPYIAFSPNGNLVDENGFPVPDQYIMLTSGGILYPSDDKGYILGAPLISENPVGESSNNVNMIHIDSTTARAKLERNQF